MTLLPSVPVSPEWAEQPACASVEAILADISNSYSVSVEAARVLSNVVTSEKKSNVLEFGAGVSSRVLAAALAENGGGRLTSVEQNPQWCEDAWTHVRATPGVDAELVVSDIHVTVDRRGVYYAYDQAAAVRQRGPFDLVFVDAPWRGYGRDGALHAVRDALAPDCVVVLDDAQRVGEQRVLRRWLLAYPELELVANDASVGRGLGVLSLSGERSGERSVIDRVVRIWGEKAYEMLRWQGSIREHERKETALQQAR